MLGYLISFVRVMVSISSPGSPEIHYVVWAGIKLMTIPLPRSLKFWHYRCRVPYPTSQLIWQRYKDDNIYPVLLTFCVYILCVSANTYAGRGMHATLDVCAGQRTPWDISCLISSRGSWRPKSGHQCWRKMLSPPGHLAGEHNPLNTCCSNWIIPSKRMNLNSHLITYTEIEPRN